MLEERLAELTKETIALRQSVEANTAALGGTKGATTTVATTKKGDKATTTTTSKHKPAEVEAMAKRVQKEVSSPAAKELIKKHGGKDLNDLITNHAANHNAFMADAEAALAPDEESQVEEEDEL